MGTILVAFFDLEKEFGFDFDCFRSGSLPNCQTLIRWKKNAPIMYMIHMTYASLHWIRLEGKGSVATWFLFATFPRHQCFWKKNCVNLKQFERQNYHRFIMNLLHLYCPRHPFALEWALDLKKFSWSHSIRDTWAEITCRSRSMPQALACGSSIRRLEDSQSLKKLQFGPAFHPSGVPGTKGTQLYQWKAGGKIKTKNFRY